MKYLFFILFNKPEKNEHIKLNYVLSKRNTNQTKDSFDVFYQQIILSLYIDVRICTITQKTVQEYMIHSNYARRKTVKIKT